MTVAPYGGKKCSSKIYVHDNFAATPTPATTITTPPIADAHKHRHRLPNPTHCHAPVNGVAHRKH